MRINLKTLSNERSALMGVSILLVMMFHSSLDVSAFPAISTIKSFGNIGVDFFLFLSGVGLYFSFNKDNELKSFYKKRVLRIIPSTIICLTPWFIYLSKTGRHVSALRFILDILSLGFWIDGDNRGWYVALSIVLYAIYPIIYHLTDANDYLRNLKHAIIIIAADIALNILLSFVIPKWYSPVELALTRVPVFIAACFIAPAIYKREELPGYTQWLLICASIVLLFILKKDISIIPSLSRYIYMALTISVTPLLSVILGKINGTVIHKILERLGRITLEIYLIHTQILTVLHQQVTQELPNRGLIINLLAVLISIVLGETIHSVLSPKKKYKQQ